MGVSLSIKNIPEELAEAMRQRAKRNHRSLQGELLAILENSVAPDERRSIDEIAERVRRLGIRTSSSSAELTREIRDAR